MGAERSNENQNQKKNDDDDRALVFTYGTLKRGFSNHSLMEELIGAGDAEYLGEHRTVENYPLVCGPYKVPFLLNLPGSGERVQGELYAVSGPGLERMDELEGTSLGHYERLPVTVVGGGGAVVVRAEAYYGHRSYAEGMWRRSGERGFGKYTAEEAKGYVRRNQRPVGTTFLDQIRLFVSSSSSD